MHAFCSSLSPSLTIGAVDAGMLVVTEEKALCALTLVAPHGVDTHLLASTIVVQTLVHICSDGETEKKREGKRA